MFLRTPFNLSLGVSLNTGKLENFATSEEDFSFIVYSQSDMDPFFTVFSDISTFASGASLEFVYKILTLRSEYFWGEIEDQIEVNTAYGEISLRVLKNLELAVRYDWSKIDYNEILREVVDIDADSSLTKHSELSLGLNYWFNYNFVVKLSYHNVDGNIYSIQESIPDIIQDGLEEETQLVIIGTQFSF